jgi:hypothetical protein
MTDTAAGATETDYSATLFLPETNFPMRAGLPDREPGWLKRWEEMDIYALQREQARTVRSSRSMTALPMPMAISISAMRSTRR